MAQDSQARLDSQFPFGDAAKVQQELRGLVRVMQERLASLEGQRADYRAVIEELTKVSLSRINEVLLPALPLLDEIIRAGFGSERILDSGFTGRELIQSKTPGEAREAAGAASAAEVSELARRLNTITDGANPLLDSFFEIANEISTNESAVSALLLASANRLRTDALQSLSAGQREIAQTNLGFASLTRTLLALTTKEQWRSGIGAMAPPDRQFAWSSLPGRAAEHDITFLWDGESLRSIIDAVFDTGAIWAGNNTQLIDNCLKLPNGLILQWAIFYLKGDVRVNYPISWPGVQLATILQIVGQVDGDKAFQVHLDQPSREAFDVRIREVVSGGLVRPSQEIRQIFMFAVGV